MSVRDYEKTTYKQEITCFNIKQAKNAIKKIEKDIKNVNYGIFSLKIEVEYNDRDSEI